MCLYYQAAATCYIELIVKESDNNVKLIVLDRLMALKDVPAHEKVLQVRERWPKHRQAGRKRNCFYSVLPLRAEHPLRPFLTYCEVAQQSSFYHLAKTAPKLVFIKVTLQIRLCEALATCLI